MHVWRVLFVSLGVQARAPLQGQGGQKGVNASSSFSLCAKCTGEIEG